ncbi:MAG: type II secretion system GspH family protein [Ruminococcus sp.]|jgi:prepilin-type N-terminal cleavage/methylation domain-containing protein|nr:type II secretion system GspH family protein [Ruminococcus sp.]
MRKLSGFTLVECLVALMVLGLASLTLAQVYAAVAKGRRENEYMNYSLAEQMAYIEGFDAGDTDVVEIEQTVTGEKASHTLNTSATNYHVVINGGPKGGTSNVYKYGVNMYILYSRDIEGRSSEDTDYAYPEESSGKLRYKYLQPREPDQTVV